ncbi:MAG: sterol desaturase family protein [Gemmatimonadota bacterium]|nr:sterol desaturase family protein [Gemmatimonadota bacterium]MDE3004818.1 sterol desaturase family protein [Gemmatimonadota bacterium]MDE3015070.1 sterol desaturase family protein [Gemmatimonadota bacterium]
MDSLLLFFELMPTWQKLAWVMTCLGLSWVLEGSLPLVQLKYRKWKHARSNFVFLGTTLAINAAFSALSIGVVTWTATSSFGLLYLFDLPTLAEMLIAIVVLDLTAQYFAHWLLHKVKFLWRFHVVHHSDTKVDATTGTRLHPGDFAVREVIALGALAATGAPLAYYVVYRLTTIFFTFLTHANVSPPRWLDASLSLVFVTPNMHKFHHHFERPWTDTNYGGILSIWDRMFGTFVYGDPHDVVYGVDVADPAFDEDVAHQMKLPFQKGTGLDRE